MVFVQTALMADELRPVATDPALDDYRKILYYRRGYAGSSPVSGPGSIRRDAADRAVLLTELDIERAHVVGLSFSGAIALQLASELPERAHSLTLIEPPPVHIPSADEFRAANNRLITRRRNKGLEASLDEFLTIIIGPDWQQVADEALPDPATQMQQDVATLFDTDLPALLAWRFGPDETARVDCPVLYIGGSERAPGSPRSTNSSSDGSRTPRTSSSTGPIIRSYAPRIAYVLHAFLGRNPT